ncbi:MAG: phenylacetate--CoA ligase family protein [Burkholderiales bacterium]|nr:MAG: phenylacetate--CoA ligase family protein [Burkholderiales bacterium]
MAEFFDALETRSPAEREAVHMAALPQQIAHAQKSTAAFAEILKRVDAALVTSRAALATLPVTRKTELHERQKASREAGGDVFGGFSSLLRKAGERGMGRIFASPGPIYEPEGKTPDYWRAGRAVFAAGFRAGDLAHNAFSYHMTPGAYLMESGAHAVGCTIFPAGTGQTEQQLQAMAELQPDGYLGTPSFLKILVEKAQESGQKLSIKKGLVGGEAFPPSLRDWFTERGMAIYQCYATADLGLIAYETSAREGMVLDEGVIVEIVRPGTGDPVPEGEVGELVVTSLNPVYPLIRFGTGDLSAVLPGQCPTGRTNSRIKGWMGRADQTTKIRGMFVHPGQVAEVVKRFPEIARARLVVSGEMANDQMVLKVETAHANTDFQEKIAHAVRDVTKLRSEVQLLQVGSLPNDGKVIEDARSYQ